jgi:hypothetical protein
MRISLPGAEPAAARAAIIAAERSLPPSGSRPPRKRSTSPADAAPGAIGRAEPAAPSIVRQIVSHASTTS